MTILFLSGIAASALIEWALLSLLHFRSGLPVVLIAAIHVALVIIANAAGIRAAASVLRRENAEVGARSRAVALWIPPLVVYFVADSTWAVPLAAFFAFTMVTLMRSIKKEGRRFILVGLQPDVRATLAITQLDKLLEIYPRFEDALSRLRSTT